MTILYVGIDVSKANIDVALTINGSDILGNTKFSNSLKGFNQMSSWINKVLKQQEIIDKHYCLEATGIYHEALTEFLQDNTSAKVSVVNPFQTKSFQIMFSQLFVFALILHLLFF